jgi:TP901 family phage tail tape measure protein
VATEKLRAELEILTAKAEKDLKRFDRSLAGVERRITSMGGKGGKSLKPLGEGLSAATVNANEFEKSMAAANARVIAFGASAGLILQVQRALKETVRATIEVEKSLTDINVVLNTNTKGLQKFGDSLFKIAGQTGQGFKTVAVAATELARQGLGMEQTLKRTSDALILTRLTGMQAEEAVSSLTAAVNSFSKAGITSSQVVNKMAKVDQAFAVSSDDLAKAISRVGSSAVDAGVSMDELLAITTAVQQRTARGGAVIGNAFKTIFTRIGRTDVQKKLAGIGVATRDMTTGAMLPATKVLENLSVKFQELSKSQQNQIAESVAGVFQVNILRAALGDLSSKYGVYNRALKESATATNEAYLKNEQLNQTLDALVNKTLANLTKAGAAIGGATLKPAIENVLGLVNSAIGAFGEGGRFEEFGKGIGKDIMTGIGNFIAGPGLVIATAGIIKLGASFVGFAKDALKGFADIGRQAATRRNVEAQITSELTRQPEILKRIQAGELSAAAAAKDMLAAMKATNLQADRLAITSRAIAANMFGLAGGTRGLRGSGAGRAQGFIPNFADPNAERASAAMGGYKAGAIKTMNIPGQGSVMYNSAETVKRFPGMQQPAIMPPQGSRAGSNYQKAFGAAHGFDPYAAGGFVPNFNKMSIKQFLGLDKSAKIKDIRVNEERSKQIEEAAAAGKLRFDDYSDNAALAAAVTRGKLRAQGNKTEQVGKNYTHNAGYLGLLGLEGSHLGTSTTSLGKIARFVDAGIDPRLLNRKVTFTNMQSKSIDEITKGSTRVNKSRFSDLISEKMTTPVSEIANEIFRKGLGDDHKIAVADLQKQFKGSHQLLPPGAEGSIFEAAVNLGLLTTKKSPKARLDAFDQSTKGAQKPFDFEESGRAKPPFKDIFHFEDPLLYADAKRTIDNKSMGTLIKKAYNQGLPGLPGLELLEGGATVAKGAKKVKALGHVPNFSPLGDAITRERAAGVPRSAIRVGASASLKRDWEYTIL